jgi:hypothetical protein
MYYIRMIYVYITYTLSTYSPPTHNYSYTERGRYKHLGVKNTQEKTENKKRDTYP